MLNFISNKIQFVDVHFSKEGLYHEIHFKVKEEGQAKLSEEHTRQLHCTQSGMACFDFRAGQHFLKQVEITF